MVTKCHIKNNSYFIIRENVAFATVIKSINNMALVVKAWVKMINLLVIEIKFFQLSL